MDWDKENLRPVSLRADPAVWDLTLLSDLLEELKEETKTSEVLSRILTNYPEAKFLLGIQTHRVIRTGSHSWKIQKMQ
jgi:hypothetical protein